MCSQVMPWDPKAQTLADGGWRELVPRYWKSDNRRDVHFGADWEVKAVPQEGS